MEPFFSIITVSYNAENLIKATLRSSLDQTFDDFEIIVKDGLSTDQTLQMIPDSDKIKVFSQADQDIYDAMNQAISKAGGKYLIFMNCGDLFYADDVLQKAYDVLKDINQPVIAYGNYDNGKGIYKQPQNMTDLYLYRRPLCHQSMIVSRRLFTDVGLYDLHYKILADFDFTMRCYRSNVPFLYIDTVVCRYQGGGVSESKKGIKIKNKERRVILAKNYPVFKRFRYDAFLMISMRKFRMWLSSDKSPAVLRNMYLKLVNKLNG